jgi:hypothetical protein
MPPKSQATEYIDCLHPLDVESGGWGAWLTERDGSGPPVIRVGCDAPGRGPICPTRPADRDRWLAS